MVTQTNLERYSRKRTMLAEKKAQAKISTFPKPMME